MDNLKSVKEVNGKFVEGDWFLQELESKYPEGINIEKSSIRKQIEPLKNSLKRLETGDIQNFLYHLKIGFLKLSYILIRKGNKIYLEEFREFIAEKVRVFSEDLRKIDQFDQARKKQALKIAVKVFKDFLNAIIVKSYFAKNETSRGPKIPSDRFNRSSYRSR